MFHVFLLTMMLNLLIVREVVEGVLYRDVFITDIADVLQKI